eukprot:403350807
MNLQSYLEDKLSGIMIYHSFAHFEKSTMSCIADDKLPIVRFVLAGFVGVSFLLQAISNPSGNPIYLRVLSDLEFYATIFAIAGLLLAHKASAVKADSDLSRTADLNKKKQALIVNEIAIMLNIACSLGYFIFMPIIYGAKSFEVDVRDSLFNAIAYFIALFAVLFHFACTRFALLDQDFKYIALALFFWTSMNLLINGNGLFFRDMKDESLPIKLFLAGFFILACYCFYYLLTIVTQSIKGYKEKHEKQKLFDQFAEGKSDNKQRLMTDNDQKDANTLA